MFIFEYKVTITLERKNLHENFRVPRSSVFRIVRIWYGASHNPLRGRIKWRTFQVVVVWENVNKN